MFRAGAEHPEIGAKFTAADVNLRIVYTEPDADMMVQMRDPWWSPPARRTPAKDA